MKDFIVLWNNAWDVEDAYPMIQRFATIEKATRFADYLRMDSDYSNVKLTASEEV